MKQQTTRQKKFQKVKKVLTTFSKGVASSRKLVKNRKGPSAYETMNNYFTEKNGKKNGNVKTVKYNG